MTEHARPWLERADWREGVIVSTAQVSGTLMGLVRVTIVAYLFVFFMPPGYRVVTFCAVTGLVAILYYAIRLQSRRAEPTEFHLTMCRSGSAHRCVARSSRHFTKKRA
jgi:hypothetical protein